MLIMFRLAWVDIISLRLPLSSPGFPVTFHFIREKYLQLHCCLNWKNALTTLYSGVFTIIQTSKYSLHCSVCFISSPRRPGLSKLNEESITGSLKHKGTLISLDMINDPSVQCFTFLICLVDPYRRVEGCHHLHHLHVVSPWKHAEHVAD